MSENPIRFWVRLAVVLVPIAAGVGWLANGVIKVRTAAARMSDL